MSYVCVPGRVPRVCVMCSQSVFTLSLLELVPGSSAKVNTIIMKVPNAGL